MITKILLKTNKIFIMKFKKKILSFLNRVTLLIMILLNIQQVVVYDVFH